MSTAIIAGLSVVNMILAAYWLCQVVELVLAIPIAWGFLRGSSVKARAVLGITGQLLGSFLVALISALTMIEAAAFLSAGPSPYANWFFHSAGFGLGAVILVTVASSRFREELEGLAWRRVTAFIRPQKTRQRETSQE